MVKLKPACHLRRCPIVEELIECKKEVKQAVQENQLIRQNALAYRDLLDPFSQA